MNMNRWSEQYLEEAYELMSMANTLRDVPSELAASYALSMHPRYGTVHCCTTYHYIEVQ